LKINIGKHLLTEDVRVGTSRNTKRCDWIRLVTQVYYDIKIDSPLAGFGNRNTVTNLAAS
jgi:hypothetical protein